jgi:protein required for attachment to host cells
MVAIHHNEWVVVCDGARALVLENAGDPDLPNFKTREVLKHKSAATHEQGTDAPGRAHSSVGAGRSAVGQTDWHDQDETAFLEGIARQLDVLLASGEVKSIVVVAPPRALGVLRRAYSPALRQAIRCEVDKDLVKMPIHEIEKHLSA